MKRGDRTDTILTLLFMVLAVAAVICYFMVTDNRLPFLYCGGAAILIRVIQYLIRFISK